jgi:cytochrome o ubiquinol oxidase subunit 1
MIIGGVVFGYFAGLTYWFPKIFGFKLNERLGRYAFWCWLVGFLLAFVPLYILGLMGATRRLDHYDPSLGWQQLFIVAGIGVAIIGLGVAFQILQVIVSIKDRHKNLDKTGDPWDGRTLEWSVASPPPVYNFASLPAVAERDAFWSWKQSKVKTSTHYQDVAVTKNTPLPLLLGVLAFSFGFGFVWHIYWLVFLAFGAIIFTLVWRSTDGETEYVIPAAKVRQMERAP